MTESWELPQPWEHAGQTQAEYTVWAVEQEASGRRLVVDTFYNAYPTDGGDCDELWLYDAHVLTDYRTGKTLHAFEYEDETSLTLEFARLLVIERVLAEA